MTGREIGRSTTAVDRAAERRQALRDRELGCRQVRAIMEEFDPEYETPNGLGWSVRRPQPLQAKAIFHRLLDLISR